MKETKLSKAKASAKKEFDRFMALPDSEKTREAEAAAKRKSRPLSAAERAMFREAGMGRRGRPTTGKGAKQISLTMEAGLLARADRFARSHGMTRARLIAAGVERVLKDAL
jgi:hypothetical protein